MHRLVFHEITKDAIQEGASLPRDVDDGLVRARDTSHFGSALRLRGVAAVVAEGAAEAIGWTRAERGRADDRRSASGWRFVSATWWI